MDLFQAEVQIPILQLIPGPYTAGPEVAMYSKYRSPWPPKYGFTAEGSTCTISGGNAPSATASSRYLSIIHLLLATA